MIGVWRRWSKSGVDQCHDMVLPCLLWQALGAVNERVCTRAHRDGSCERMPSSRGECWRPSALSPHTSSRNARSFDRGYSRSCLLFFVTPHALIAQLDAEHTAQLREHQKQLDERSARAAQLEQQLRLMAYGGATMVGRGATGRMPGTIDVPFQFLFTIHQVLLTPAAISTVGSPVTFITIEFPPHATTATSVRPGNSPTFEHAVQAFHSSAWLILVFCSRPFSATAPFKSHAGASPDIWL